MGGAGVLGMEEQLWVSHPQHPLELCLRGGILSEVGLPMGQPGYGKGYQGRWSVTMGRPLRLVGPLSLSGLLTSCCMVLGKAVSEGHILTPPSFPRLLFVCDRISRLILNSLHSLEF